jgi:hypothetical protein
MAPAGVTRSLRVLIVAAAWVVSGCHGRPLTVPRGGRWLTVARPDAASDAPDARDAATEQAPDVACGGPGQSCCGSVCDTGLTCDHAAAPSAGVCTGTCGHADGACCHKGECEQGAACTTQDETGTCQSCGLIGLTCCRGDCWSGICEYTDAPRHCVACGQKGQPCCGDELSASICADGVACDRPAGRILGTCTDACSGNGQGCCRGGGCRSELSCTTSNESGICRPCGGVGEACCADGCRAGGACSRTASGDLVCVSV